MKFLIAVILILATGLSVESRGRIYGGSTADPRNFPFLVRVIVPYGTTASYCGGSLISYSWIMTAGHCFMLGDETKTEISMGLNADHQFTKTVKAIRVIKHKDYFLNDSIIINDIALVEIPKVVQSEQIRSILLGRSINIDFLTVTIAGLGLTDISTRASKLQFTTGKIMDHKSCLISGLGPAYRSTQFCTLNSASSICKGDSGGPVIKGEGLNAELVGIVSYYPHSNCSADKPNAFTRVSSFLPWIKENTGL